MFRSAARKRAFALGSTGCEPFYQAWAREEGQWVLLGTVAPDSDGVDHLIAENSALVSAPDAVEITVESDGGSHTPSDAVVLRWLPRRSPATLFVRPQPPVRRLFGRS